MITVGHENLNPFVLKASKSFQDSTASSWVSISAVIDVSGKHDESHSTVDRDIDQILEGLSSKPLRVSSHLLRDLCTETLKRCSEVEVGSMQEI
jgi:hypothetical protein